MSRSIARFAFIRNGLNRPRGICSALPDATARLELDSSPSPQGHLGGSPGLWRAIVSALLGLLVAIAACTYLVGQRDEALHDAEIDVRNRSLALGEWVEAVFRSIDLLETGAVEWIQAESIDTPEALRARFATPEGQDSLRARMAALSRVRNLFLIDAGGAFISGAIPRPAPDLGPISDALDALRDSPERDPVLSAPWRDPADGQWMMLVSRRIAAPDGRFLGIIAASVDLASFEQLFARIALGPHSAMSLFDRDGLLLTRYPRLDERIGTADRSDIFRQLLSIGSGGVLRGRSPLDGLDRIIAVQTVDGYPLVLIASRPVDEVLTAWRRAVPRVGLIALVAEIVILSGVVLINRQEQQRAAMRRLQAARAEADAKLALSEQRERAARLAAEREAALNAMFDNGTAGIVETDLVSRRFVRVNRRYCEITGRTEAELLGGLGPADVLHPADRDVIKTYRAAATTSGNWDAEVRYLRPDGTVVWARVSAATSARDTQGHPLRWLVIVQDITRRREAEELLHMTMEVGRIGSFRHDIVNNTFQCSPETRAMLGLLMDEAPIAGETFFARVVAEDRDRMLAEIQDLWARRTPKGAINYRTYSAEDDNVRHVETRMRVSYDVDGRPVSALGAMIDVTERRLAEDRITHLAHHDALTGLPNRLLFRKRLDGALARAKRGEGFAVLLIDLDRFKEVNDTLGHPTGDALLRKVAERLQAELRETDVLARLGGDEFAVIRDSVDQPRSAIALARRLVEELSRPFELDGHQIIIGTSLGIALAPLDGLDPDGLIKGADIALYRAKADGRGCWRFFEPEMDARMQARRTLERDLHRALAMGEFELFYQPVIDIHSRQVSGLEALLRWRHPERGLVPPDAFIPLAEEIGLIIPIGEWALSRACTEVAGWPGNPKIAVNLSPAQFAYRGLVEAVAAALATSGLDPARLELEITETVMLQDTEAILATLHRLKALGVRIAMDDFGTGYSSLSYLQRFPFDKVKIDRSFTCGLEQSPQSNAIVRAVVNLCAMLHMTTTAEGVETEAQFQTLVREGCGEAQGYLFSKPKPANDIPALLRELDPIHRAF